MKKNYFLTLLFTLVISSFGYSQVIITELADPNNDSTARYVEIYNAGSSAVDLTGWELRRWTNANTNPQTTGVDLTSLGSFPAGSFAIIAANGTGFQDAFGISADIIAGTGGAADSNGDDQIAIFDDSDVTIDIFGVPGEDGSGTCHEFEDGRAERKANVKTAKTTWSEADWNVWADTTVSGCTSHVNSPQNAPGGNFDPKSWIGASSDPIILISSPTDNEVLNPETTSTDVTLSISNFTVASGGTGDGYITYTLNGGTAVDKFDTNVISISSLTAGSSYEVVVELVDNSGNPLSPVVSASLNFSVATYTTVADLAALRAGTEGDYYEVTGEVIYTFEGTSRNQKYIQDATAAVLIDDNDGTITTSYTVGDGLTGLKGRLGSFGGVIQLIPIVDPGAATSSGNQIPQQVVTIAELNANLDNYESEFVTINGVSFSDADGTATFSTGSNYDITNGTDTMVFRVHFSGTDIDGTIIPSSSANITGITGEFNGTSQVFGIDLANIVLSTRYNEIVGFSLYPNPVKNGKLTITTNSTETKQVSIFNVLGKNVLNTTISGTKAEVNTSGISAGIYILKVVEGGKTATSKLIIR